MTKEITLEQALELVDFAQYIDGTWLVKTVKGNCGTVVGGHCGTVKGNCHTIEGDCQTVEGRVHGTINGRQWQYVETPREKMVRLLEGGASKEELLKALEELND